MKVLCLLLLGVVALSVAPATNAVQLDRIALESFAKVHGTRCGDLHCPYDNAICCQGKTGQVAVGERKATCCPNGYKCSYPDQRPTTCVRAKAVSVSINPSLSSGSSPSTAAQAAGSMSGSVSGPSMSASADPMASSASSGMGSATSAMGSASMGSVAGAGSSSMAMDGSSSAAPGAVQPQQNVPKFRQNIIIVKNINVLTKLQQPPKGGSSSAPAPQPQPAQESSEESSRSEESSSGSSSAESSESGSGSQSQ